MMLNINRNELQTLYRYCYSLVNNKNEADDLLQSGLEKWLKLDQQKDYSLAYIRKIIRNQFIDQCRRKKRVPFEQFDETTPLIMSSESMEQALIDDQEVELLMDKLNAGERETLFLWAVMEYSASEIASETGEPRGTILSRLYRIKSKINSENNQTKISISAGGEK